MKDNKSAYNSSIYDEHITNVLPYYKEYHNQALNVMMSDAEFFYGIFAVVLIMAIVYFVLSIITNSKEKKLASAVS